MRLHSITIEGFRSFRLPETVDLSNIALAAITGPNHAGKTSILRSIDYALYGPAHGEAKSLVNRRSKRMWVSLTIEVGSDTYVIERSHKSDGTGHKVVVTQGTTQVSSRDLATTQNLINELVGMGRDIARVTWMSMQGDIESLALMDGPTRRATFVKAFGLDRYDALSKAAKDERREQSRELERLVGKLAGLSESLDSDPGLADWTDDELSAELGRHDAFARAERDWAERDRLIAQQARLADEAEQLDVQAGDFEPAQRALDEATDAVNAARTALDDATAKKAHAVSANDISQRTVDQLTDQLNEAKSRPEGDCDRCGQHLTAQAHAFMLKALAGAVAEATEALGVTRIAKGAAVQVWEELSATHRAAVSTRDTANKRVEKATMATATMERIRREQLSVGDRLAELSVADIETNEPDTDRAAISDEMHVRKLRTDREAVAQAVQAEVDAATARLAHLDLLAAAWSPSGIPMTILRGVADEVTSDANAILDSMGSELVVDIDASGASVDLLVGDAEWSSLSGQERFYVALALRLALGRAVAQRTGHEVATMLLDEGWGALDAEHAQKAVEALAGLTKRVGILTVTHIEDIGAQMPQHIEVDATSGTSRALRR